MGASNRFGFGWGPFETEVWFMHRSCQSETCPLCGAPEESVADILLQCSAVLPLPNLGITVNCRAA